MTHSPTACSAPVFSGSPTFPDPAYTSCMLDPVTISVLTHRFSAIVEEMGEAMLRTAYSQILNSSRDFSTAICDGQARLVAQAEHVPIHVGAIPWAVESARGFVGAPVRPGGVLLRNH